MLCLELLVHMVTLLLVCFNYLFINYVFVYEARILLGMSRCRGYVSCQTPNDHMITLSYVTFLYYYLCRCIRVVFGVSEFVLHSFLYI